MRMRKKKWAEPFLADHPEFVIPNPEEYKGKWNKKLGGKTLHVEIGTGKGEYITQMAQKDLNTSWVGIEVERNVAAVCAKKALSMGECPNECLIVGDASEITNWFKKEEVDVIHLNFSDPWPRNKNRKKRLTHNNFLMLYKQILKKNGHVIVKTDNSGLFEFTLVEMTNHGFKLEECYVNFREQVHDEDAISEYESKFMELGQPIYRAVLVME